MDWNLVVLREDCHAEIIRAVENLLATQQARNTLALVADGKPTNASAKRHGLRHTSDYDLGISGKSEPSLEAIDIVQNMLQETGGKPFYVQAKALHGYLSTNCTIETRKIRLFECLASVFHNIASTLFLRYFPPSDDPSQHARGSRHPPEPLLFFPGLTMKKSFPQKRGDVVGFWAQSELFGGVAVFERGESGLEARSAWIKLPNHQTFQLSEAQLDDIFSLAGESPSVVLPLQPAQDANILSAQGAYQRKIYQDMRDFREPHVVHPKGIMTAAEYHSLAGQVKSLLGWK